MSILYNATPSVCLSLFAHVYFCACLNFLMWLGSSLTKVPYLRTLEFPWYVSHNINSISTTNTNTQTTKAASVRCVGVRSNHE